MDSHEAQETVAKPVRLHISFKMGEFLLEMKCCHATIKERLFSTTSCLSLQAVSRTTSSFENYKKLSYPTPFYGAKKEPSNRSVDLEPSAFESYKRRNNSRYVSYNLAYCDFDPRLTAEMMG